MELALVCLSHPRDAQCNFSLTGGLFSFLGNLFGIGRCLGEGKTIRGAARLGGKFLLAGGYISLLTLNTSDARLMFSNSAFKSLALCG